MFNESENPIEQPEAETPAAPAESAPAPAEVSLEEQGKALADAQADVAAAEAAQAPAAEPPLAENQAELEVEHEIDLGTREIRINGDRYSGIVRGSRDLVQSLRDAAAAAAPGPKKEKF